jgi:membrane-bound ClpP family serine protease
MNALYWAIALQVLAVALLMAEIFIPSGGLLALATAGTLIGSLVVGFNASPEQGWILLALDLVVFPPLIWWGLKQVEKSSMALPERLDNGGGEDESLLGLMGKEGVTETDLRPVGHVRLENRMVDAQSKSGFLMRGSKVVVVAVSGNRVVVKALDASVL